MVRLEMLIDNWKSIRQDTAQAVEDFPAGELDYRPVAEVMTFREIARHILEASHGITGLLLSGDDNLSGPTFRERVRQHITPLPADAGAAAIAAALRASIEERGAEIARKPPEFWAQMITRMDGQAVTRMEMLQLVREHELTHRSQLFLYLRLKGVVPSTTRRRMAKQAVKSAL